MESQSWTSHAGQFIIYLFPGNGPESWLIRALISIVFLGIFLFSPDLATDPS